MSQSKLGSPVPPEVTPELSSALGRVPSGRFVLTAHHEDRRGGMLVDWVQRVCQAPPMLSVAVEKGKPIMPLISESRRFALCQLGEDDRVMRRKFARDSEPGDDPFLGYDLVPSKLGGVPIIKDALAYFECELACHMDVEGDHDLFVGVVHAAGAQTGQPWLRFDTEDAPMGEDSPAAPDA
ncbi:MAG: flavin reductase family protein [Planctomycetota bacterium]